MNNQTILIIVQTVILFVNIIYLILTSKEIEKNLKGAVGVLMGFAALGILILTTTYTSLKERVIEGIIYLIIAVIIISIPLIIEKKVTAFLKMPFYIMNTHKKITVIVLILWLIGMILIHFNLYGWWFLSAGGMLMVWLIKVVKDNKATWFSGPNWFGK
ncbi:MAG: hypothetical protein M1381_09765 [Deltaproteobacteria bacterium]|nr:hypothetical protein [Deltaproteobacteria bacterium]